MKREELTGYNPTPQWKCVESRVDGKCLYYGRFILSPLRKGQADTIGIAMRRALLREVEGTCITRAKFREVPHEYSPIVGIEESVQDILLNLKEIVLRSNLYGVSDALICVKGPKYITAQDIILPPSVEIVDTTQYIANLTEPVDFCIELQIKRDRGYHREPKKSSKDGSYPIDAVFMPIKNVNYNIFSYGKGNEKYEILSLEIWTNGSLTPREALYEASRNLIDLFIPFLCPEDTFLEENQNQKGLTNLKKERDPMETIFIDQLELPSRTYCCLKRVNIHTLADVADLSEDGLSKLIRITNFSLEDAEHLSEAVTKYFSND